MTRAFPAIALFLIIPNIMMGIQEKADADKEKELRERIITTARGYLGQSYKYGDTGVRGFDCSGFVQFIYHKFGMNLPRTSDAQYEKGEKIDLKDARPADLVFFKINGRNISHVGIYLGDRSFIHAPRTGKKVSIARMDSDYWSLRFAGAATYLSPNNKSTSQ